MWTPHSNNAIQLASWARANERKMLGLSQKQAAEALGLKRRMVQYYETGQRDGEKVAVPKTVRLACWALASGIADYHGPDAKPQAESGDADSGSPERQDG